jgi:hypothetical protein
VWLNSRDKRLAEFSIGDTENCAIGDPGHAYQYLLDFGRIDVHPA